MKNVITNDVKKCVGCNRCVRVCPIDEANIAFMQPDGKIKIKVDNRKCIACGSCLVACYHNSRHYEDDTKRFFDDLSAGQQISMFAAPAIKSNFDNYERLLAWLGSLGVNKIFDVSLGADICTWAHIRYIQKNNPGPIISQPCPAIVDYILIHKHELIKYLSPIHSPMLCTAVYMKRYKMVGNRIAALSPCVAKSHEFDATGLVDYNVTFKSLDDYIRKNYISLPAESKGFDNLSAGLGSIYPMPGGLKECVEHYLGKAIRIDKSEGQKIVYHALNEYAKEPLENLPAVFDVLNCLEGCNAGTGCVHNMSTLEINTKMDALRQSAIKENNSQYTKDLFKKFDETLRLEDFIRDYSFSAMPPILVNEEEIEKAFVALGKHDDAAKNFNCGACGSETCREMAIKIAKGVNIPENCTQKVHEDVDTMIKEISDEMDGVANAISSYNKMVTDIERISEKVNIISLNASVEAAKAGKQGVTFEVVAKTIRKLAQSSADSAEKTKEASERANNAMGAVNKTILKIKEKIQSTHKID